MNSRGYQIDRTLTVTQLKEFLRRSFSCKPPQHHTFHRYYLDTLDWRLLSAGWYLQAEKRDNSTQLKLFRLADHKLISQSLSEKLPSTPEELPEGKLAKLITPVMKMRALVDQVKLKVSQHQLCVTNNEDKIVAQLTLETSRLINDSDNKTNSAETILWHHPVRGYDKKNNQINKLLSEHPQLSATNEPSIQLLLSEHETETSQLCGKLNFKLNNEDRTDASAKLILNTFLATMERNRSGVINDIDTECLHDFRIAVRRTRSLLGQVPEIMPKQTLERYKTHFARLGAITTPQRDYDVMLLNFDEYRALLPRDEQAALDPAFEFIKQRREQAYQSVARHLQSAGYQRFLANWNTYLDAPVPAHTTLTNAKQPTKLIADERIWKAYKKVLNQGNSITKKSPPEALHTLRKTCKKLRYLIEFFQSLYPKKKTKAIIRTMKELQDNLGEYQDLHVHMEFFDHLREEMEQNNVLTSETEHALLTIVKMLDVEQERCRHQFKTRFRNFSSKDHHKQFVELYNA